MKIVAEGKRIGMISALIVVVTFFYYFPGFKQTEVQAFLARGYYLPIVLSGIWFGLRGGLLASVICGLLHLCQGLVQQGSVSLQMQDWLELCIFIAVGVLTGVLVQNTGSRKGESTETADEAKTVQDRLASQTEKLLKIEHELRLSDRLAVVTAWGDNLAAEMKGPLEAIRRAVDRLKKEPASGGIQAEFSQTVIRETNRLIGIVDNALQMVRAKKQRMINCDLNDIVQSVLDLLSGQTRQQQIDLIMVKPGKPIAIFADVTLMRQALLNVLLQSMASLEANGRVVISCSCAAQKDPSTRGRLAQITISDTSRGMTASQAEHIFEPLRSTGGTDLGMAIAKWAVLQMKGEIKLESVEGAGTTVTILVPCAEEKEPNPWQHSRQRPR